jgi:hypothetical protein
MVAATTGDGLAAGVAAFAAAAGVADVALVARAAGLASGTVPVVGAARGAPGSTGVTHPLTSTPENRAAVNKKGARRMNIGFGFLLRMTLG